FTRCSLDDDIGTATRLKKPKLATVHRQSRKDWFDGDSEGGFNLDLRWETDEKLVVDEPAAWEMTLFLAKGCKAPQCTVDVTPRRCRRFRAKRGQKLQWTVTSAADGKAVQSGTAVADKHGLVTAAKVPVLKAGSKLRIAAVE
ncbi:MAG TPA: hypothetical protein VM031_04385, partial [Phycisphaerae bacterium]|nr:hypothetical protein [Phycisphaerae bacterium]